MLSGATPVFVDIDRRTYNIDPQRIEGAVTERTRAIMAVSLFGQCADFDRINEIGARYDLTVIEDGAQSFGATYKGRGSCGLTTLAAASFYPSKPLGCYGDGGALFAADDALAQIARELTRAWPGQQLPSRSRGPEWPHGHAAGGCSSGKA